MRLVGQYDSPFVRRVAVTLLCYGIGYDHDPASAFDDGDYVARFNPLCRVPALALGDGEVLVESGLILDHLDLSVPAARALIARSGRRRRNVQQVVALAMGVCDKAISFHLERALHANPHRVWLDRCSGQIEATLDWLEARSCSLSTPYWGGARLSHADVALTCMANFLADVGLTAEPSRFRPALHALVERCGALAPLIATYRPLRPPRPTDGGLLTAVAGGCR